MTKDCISIIGDGFQTKRIKEFIHKNQLKNILWESYKPAEEARDVFLSADIFLVTREPELRSQVSPVKHTMHWQQVPLF